MLIPHLCILDVEYKMLIGRFSEHARFERSRRYGACREVAFSKCAKQLLVLRIGLAAATLRQNDFSVILKRPSLKPAIS